MDKASWGSNIVTDWALKYLYKSLMSYDLLLNPKNNPQSCDLWTAPDCLHSIWAGEDLLVTHRVRPVDAGQGLGDHLTVNIIWSQDYQNLFSSSNLC